MLQKDALKLISEYPVAIGHAVGFDRLTDIHNKWIISMIFEKGDHTLQGHRGSYKTTCLSVALACIMLLYTDLNILFMRKTDTDVKEIVKQVSKILQSDVFKDLSVAIWGKEVTLTTSSATEITTNLYDSSRGSAQLVARGINGSLTGKHYDMIFTDDIVNRDDRVSKAERENTKSVYQELQNIKNRGGRIYNTGTPWHKDDAFVLMPKPERYDCYSTGLIDAETLEKLRASMTSSLFAANYELKHIADDDVIFPNPKTGADAHFVEQGICHVDAAYGGEDFTAFTLLRKVDNKYYILGKCWRKHVDDCEDEIIRYRKAFNAGKIYCENNGDKGYLAKDLRSKGERVVSYHEDMNKFLKITSYLKAVWEDCVFVIGTDDAYIAQITEYNENSEHDDCPDSLASLIRKVWHKSDQKASEGDSVNMFL